MATAKGLLLSSHLHWKYNRIELSLCYLWYVVGWSLSITLLLSALSLSLSLSLSFSLSLSSVPFRSFSVVLFMYCHLVLFSAEFLAIITTIILIYNVTGHKPSNSMFENRVIFYVTISCLVLCCFLCCQACTFLCTLCIS